MSGDLGLLEGKDESDLVFLESTFDSTGVKLSYVIPENKKLILVGGKVIGDGTDIVELHYANRALTTFPIEVLRGYIIHGDGNRKLEIISIKASGSFKVIFFGYLVDINPHTPSKPVNISAISSLADAIEITFDAPLDNGGSPITQYIIKRSETIDGAYNTLEKIITRLPDDLESNITYVDEGLEDNKEYFYKIITVNSIGEGVETGIISTTTEIDHPGQIPTLIVSSLNSTQNKLIFEFPSDTGGSTLVGIKIERSLSDSEFVTIVENTENLNTEYIDTGLDTNTTYYYRTYAINQAGKLSLIPSDIDFGTPVYDPPTNLIIQTIQNDTIAQLDWTAPVDTNSLSVQKYVIYRRLGGEVDFSVIGETVDDTTSYEDSTTMANKIYDYMVIGIIDNEETPQSISQSILIPIRSPTIPTDFVVASILETQIDLTWNIPLDDGGICPGWSISVVVDIMPVSTPSPIEFTVIIL